MNTLIPSGFTISGDVSVEPVPTGSQLPRDCYKILIIGSTGAGKSNFIEALADKSQNLGISKDQLCGYTQEVSAYQLVNVFENWSMQPSPVYLIDTPGFGDPNISEYRIMDKISTFMASIQHARVNCILFLTPITATRLSGCSRHTIEMLKAFLTDPSGFRRRLDSVSFVTTMWDTLHNERLKQRAESNFEQLKGEIFKVLIDRNAQIARFTNTRQSALEILGMLEVQNTRASLMINKLRDDCAHRPQLYQDLHRRIETALQIKKTINADLDQPETQAQDELVSILTKDRRANEEILNKLIIQLIRFGVPPVEFKEAALNLRRAIQVGSDLARPESSYLDIFIIWDRGEEIDSENYPDEDGAFDNPAHYRLQKGGRDSQPFGVWKRSL